MDRRRAAGVLLALAACVAYATAAPTASNHTTLDLYDGAPDGCYYNFQHYGEGDRIMTNEPCLNCTCHNRMLMCYLRVCPFTKPIGQDCTIEKRADQCCPIVTCPDVPVDLLTSTTTSPAEYGATGLGKLDKFGCSIHGKYFPEGSKVPPTPNKPCEHCYCIRNMTTCVMQECTLHVDGCTPIYHKDVCCPVRYSCDHPEDEMPLLDDLSTTVRPTPGFLLTSTTLSPVTQMSQDCLYENQIISDGALIKTEKACDHCYCMKGDIVCVVQECGTPMENEGKNCTALAPREGVCCPDTYICEGDEPTTGTYESLDHTTELEKLTTLTPPRRAGSEGSGYRNEPDGILNTDLPAFETEIEGSGYEQATIHPADELPDRHKIVPSNEMSSTVEPHEFIAITTTKESDSDQADVTTESGVHKDTASQQYEPSTTSTYISQKVDESSTTKAQDEDIGSGEEDIKTPDEIIPASSASPDMEVSEPTVATIESNEEDDSEKVTPTINAPVVDEDKSNIPKEQSTLTADSAIELTTEIRPHLDDDEDVKGNTLFDEQYQATEHDLLPTTSVPIVKETEREPTTSPKQDTTTIGLQLYSTSTSASGYEDEIATTESQDVVTDGFEDFGVHHQMAITASTPLLEEIEKDTSDQENIPDEITPDRLKTSTTSPNLPTEEAIYEDSFKPDLRDKTMSTNIPTIVPQKPQETDVEDSSELQQHPATTIASAFDDGTKKTATSESETTPEPQKGQETDIKESSETQQYVSTTSVPLFEGDIKKTTPSDSMVTSKLQESQEIDVEESSESQQYVPTTSAPTFEDDAKKTTPSHTMSTSKTQEDQETDVEESSKPQPYAPTTSAPAFEIKETTPLDTMATSKLQESQEIDVEESSEPQQYAPTTSAPVSEDDLKKTTPSDSLTTSKAQEIQGTYVEESSEPQQYASTTSAPVSEDDLKKTTPSDSLTTSKAQEIQGTDVEESSEAQQYAPTTGVPLFEGETKKTTPSDSMATSKSQESQETDVKESSESQQYVPTTSAPTFEDDAKKTTLSDYMTTSRTQEGQETDVEESSKPQPYAPTTSGPTFEDKKTTPLDTMATSKKQEIQGIDVEESSEAQQYVPTTSGPTFEDELKKTTPSEYMTTFKTQEDQKPDVQESSEPQQNVPTISAPTFEDEIKETTPFDSMTTHKIQESQITDIDESSEAQQYAPTTSVPTSDDETKKIISSISMTTVKTQEDQEIGIEESSEPQQYAPTTSAPTFEDDTKKTTPSTTMTTTPQQRQETDVEESSEKQQHVPTTSGLSFEDELKKTTPSITTFKTQEDQKTDVEESSEPQQNILITSAPSFEDEIKETTPSDSTHKTQDSQKTDVDESSEANQYGPTTSASLFVDETKKTSTATSFDQNEINTAEPDKALNTIPSGSVEEETTESPELEKHTYGDALVPTESATEFENKFGDKTDSITEYTTLTPDTSASKEDQFVLPTESTMKEDVDRIGSTQSADITKYTTELANISEETISTLSHDHPSSSELPVSEYQQTSTSPVPFSTETIKQSADSQEPTATYTYYESTSQDTKLEDSTSEKHEAITNSPYYSTVPSSTTADLEENEIINESRIPGEGDCLLNGVTYRNESRIPSTNKCQSGCRCSSSIIKCDPIICSPPPEYMDNCQTTYDSLDSCCPTYVCDHKTETMPPQSHSQMSGTEAPVVSPIACKGDDCVLGDDKNNPVETSELCKSGSCTSQFPSNIPEQPEADRHEGCKGNECTSSDSTDQLLCSKENGCQASPVKPCEGTACKDTSDITPPQKQQPCVDGNNCDVPVKDCSAGECDSGGEDITHDIEKECTEKSCKRKDDFEIEQPPKKCSGPDCPSTDFTSGVEKLTTRDNLDIVTEKIEKSSVPPSLTTTPIENQDQTNVFNDEIDTKISTIIPDAYLLDKMKDDGSTQAEDKVYTKSPDLSFDKQSTTEIAEEIKTHTVEKQEVTTLPLELDDQETTTLVSIERDTEPSKIHTIEQQTTQQPGKDIPTPTSVLEEIITEPPKTQLEADDNAIISKPLVIPDVNPEEVTKSPADKNEDATSKTSAIYVMEEATKLPQVSDVEEATTTVNEEIGSTTSKTYDSNSHEATKSPQVTTVTVTETSKPHVTDLDEITKTTKESQNEEATNKSTNEFTTKSEGSDVQETTKSPDTSESDEITIKPYIEEKSTELSKPYEVTKSPEVTQSELTTTAITQDTYTKTSRPLDTDIKEVTQSPKETESQETTSNLAEEIGTDTSQPFDKDQQKTTLPSAETHSEETTKKPTVTEPSILGETEEQTTLKSPGALEFTTIKITDEIDTEPSKQDEMSHVTTVQQQDFDTEDSIVSKFKNETSTESSKPDEPKPLETTKSPLDFDSEEITTKVTKETGIEPTKSGEFEPQPVTQTSESESSPLPDITTSKSSEEEHTLSSESHSLEKSTTSHPDTISELTTQSTLEPDSKVTEPEKANVNEITTGIEEQSQSTQLYVDSDTEHIDKPTTTSSISFIHKEGDVTSISDNDIMTESPLDRITKHGPHSEETISYDQPTKDSATTTLEIDLSITDETVTKSPKENYTQTPDKDTETTKVSVGSDEMTSKPTSSIEDDKMQEDINTKVPVLLDTEKDTISEITSSKPSDATDTSYEVNIKTEKPEIIVSPKDEQPAGTLDKTTEKLTESPIELYTTKLPVDSGIEPESYTDKPSHVESSEIGTLEKDKSETPFVNELTTFTSGDGDNLTESPISIVKEPETTQYQVINTEPTESGGETYTKQPLNITSEVSDKGSSTTPEQSVDEIPEPTTEHSDILTNIPTEYSVIVDTEKPIETTQKESPDTQIIAESTTSSDGTENKETEAVVTEISTVQEFSTKQETPTDVHKLSTESPKETYTEASEKPVSEKIYESITESVEKVTKDTEIIAPGQEVVEPSQPTVTESAEHMTKVQDQGDYETVELATGITDSKDFDSIRTTPSIIKTTRAPDAIETSTPLMEMITSQPGEDIVTSTLFGTTMRTDIGDESIMHVDKENTEIPVTVSDQQTVEIVTRPQPVGIDMATIKHETTTELIEEEFIPSRTGKPEMYPTTLTTAEEFKKSTQQPAVEEASTTSDQTLLTSIEYNVTEAEQSATTIVSDFHKTHSPDIEVQTEKVTATTESPLLAEPSPETTTLQEEKLTTAKAEELTTASPVFDRFTKPTHKPSEAPATEQPKPIPTEKQPTDDLLTPDEEPSIPPSGTSGYGSDPDYMEEDQTFGPGTCRYGGKVYVSAQQIPRDDPCDFCFCFRSDIICLQQSCPPPIHGCHEEPISGFCCPRYECPVSMATTVNVTTTTTTTTTTVPPHFPVHSYKGSAQKRGCLIKGHSYKVGEVVRASSGPCLHCTCGGDGQMKCDPKQCTPEPMLRQMIAAAVSAKRRR